jgi:DNA-binding transcriptional LysR family regulator
MDQFAAVDTFIAVVEEGSLSQAARRLGKTPSAVTKTMAALEQQLGVCLLQRTTRKVVLTERGQLYLATAYEVMQKLREGARQLAELDQTPRGMLKVTAAQSFGRAVLAGLCAPFGQAYPEVKLEVSLSDRYVDLVGEGFDLALRMGNYDLPNQIVKPLGSNRTLLCASPAYLERRGWPQTPEELGNHHCLVYRHPMLSTLWRFSRAGQQVVVEPRGMLSADSYNLLQEAALGGAGILPCPQWSVAEVLERRELVPVLSEWSLASAAFGEEQICAVYPASRRGSPKVKAFIDWVERHLADVGARVERVLAQQGR